MAWSACCCMERSSEMHVFFISMFSTHLYSSCATVEAVWRSASVHVKKLGNPGLRGGECLQVFSQLPFSLELHWHACNVHEFNSAALPETFREHILLGKTLAFQTHDTWHSDSVVWRCHWKQPLKNSGGYKKKSQKKKKPSCQAQLHFSHGYRSYIKINLSTWAELVILQQRKPAGVARGLGVLQLTTAQTPCFSSTFYSSPFWGPHGKKTALCTLTITATRTKSWAWLQLHASAHCVILFRY